VPVKAQAVMTSTYGHPRLNWPATAKVNISALFLFVITPVLVTNKEIYI